MSDTVASLPASAPAGPKLPAMSQPVVPVPQAPPGAAPAPPAAPAGDALGLAEKVAVVRREERRIAGEREKLKADIEELARLRAAGEEAKRDPLAALKAHGHTLESAQLAHLEAAKRGEPISKATSEATAAREEVSALKAEIERERLERKVQGIRTDIERSIAGADVDLLRVYRSREGDYTGTDLVLDTIRERWEKSQENMSIPDAIAAVEQALEEAWAPEIAKSTKLRKIIQGQIDADAKSATKPTGKPADQASGKARAEDGPPTLRDVDPAVVNASNGANDWDSRIARSSERLQRAQ